MERSDDCETSKTWDPEQNKLKSPWTRWRIKEFVLKVVKLDGAPSIHLVKENSCSRKTKGITNLLKFLADIVRDAYVMTISWNLLSNARSPVPGLKPSFWNGQINVNSFKMSDMVLAIHVFDTSDLSDMDRKLVLMSRLFRRKVRENIFYSNERSSWKVCG